MAAAAPFPRWLRWAGAALAVLALAVAATWFTLGRLFPPARLAELLAREVKAATGRNFQVSDDLSIQVLPRIAVVARGLVLGNAAWGSRPAMARLDRAAFEVALGPLLEGRIEILRLDVDGADLLLESDGKGQVNWLFNASEPPPAPAAASAPAAGSQTVTLQRVAVRDTRLTYRDGFSGQSRSALIRSFDLVAEGQSDRIVAELALGDATWTVQGRLGRLLGLGAEGADWPFQAQFSSPGASLSVRGEMGTGARAGTVHTDLQATLTQAAPLLALAPAIAHLPLPASLQARFDRTPQALRISAIEGALAGQAFSGEATVHTDGPAPRLEARLTSPALDLARLLPPAAPAGAAAAPRPAAAGGGALFDDRPLPFDILGALPTGRLALSVGRLAGPGLPTATDLQATLHSAPGRLALEQLAFTTLGGPVSVQAELTQDGQAAPQVTLRAEARGLSMQALDALALQGRHFGGGQASAQGRLSLSGRTPRQLAASATGSVLLQAQGTTLLGNTAVLDQGPLVTLLNAVLPQRGASGPMSLQCVVVRLPLQQGMARIDRSIALETPQLAVASSGEIDLRRQTLSLAFRPSVKKGLGLSPASLAGLVMLQGPLHSPGITIDAKGTAREAVVLGAAVATGGLSLLATRLLDTGDGTQACRQALGGPGAPAAAAAAKPVQAAKSGARSGTDALRKLFTRP